MVLLDKFNTRIYDLNSNMTTNKPNAEFLVEKVVANIYTQYADRLCCMGRKSVTPIPKNSCAG